MIAERILHAIIFGRHFHSCPSELCHGKEQPCSDPYDCQRGPKLCGDCNYIQNEDEMELLGSSSGAEGLGNRKSGYGSDGLDTQSALASSVCHRLLGSNRHQGGEMLSGDEEPRRYVGSSPTPSEQISPELLPNSFTFKVAKTFPELWERYKLACAQERKGES